MQYFALFYHVVDDFISRRSPYRDDHLRLARQANSRGELVLGGAFIEPTDRVLCVFRAPEKSVVEDFVKSDPYVINGLVIRWEIRLWTVAIGGETAKANP